IRINPPSDRTTQCWAGWQARDRSARSPRRHWTASNTPRRLSTIILAQLISWNEVWPQRSASMARAIWSGSISFGLVNVPVKLFTAVSPKEVRFHMVHDADGARIKQKRVCSADGKEVPYEHIAKGYEISPGQYVVISREELEEFDPKVTHTIDIEEFVDLAEIDPVYYQTTYYLAPDRGAAKAYALLVQAMNDAGKVGIAKVIIRTKQYLCAVRPIDKLLAVSTMLFADEIVPASKLEGMPSSEAKPKERELAMAEQLIQSLAAKFEPT